MFVVVVVVVKIVVNVVDFVGVSKVVDDNVANNFNLLNVAKFDCF